MRKFAVLVATAASVLAVSGSASADVPGAKTQTFSSATQASAFVPRAAATTVAPCSASRR